MTSTSDAAQGGTTTEQPTTGGALTADELKADLTVEQLKQLVGLVDYDASSDPFPVTAMDAVGFVVGKEAAHAFSRRLRLEIDLGDADAELGLDRPQRLVGAHQAPPRERLAHVREIHDVILLAGGDMQEIELRLGGERDPQRVDEGLGAGVGEVGRMEDGADLHADEMPGIASGSLA